jgi:glycosyltransferase involved in cell wall biosynthesis
MTLDFSLVTITMNNRDGLQETLNSVLSQEGVSASWELIVIDNLSSDGTEAFMATFSDPRVVYVREADSGIYDALNKGTAKAKGRRVIYLNAGDSFHDSRSFAHMVGVSTRAPNAALVVFGAVQVAPSGDVKRLRNVPHQWFSHAFNLRSHCHAAIVFDAGAVKAAGGYSMRFDFAGDFDLIMRLGLLAPVVSDPRVCIRYEGTGLSARRKAEIPLLLHRVRADRFQYPRWAEILDRSFVFLLGAYRTALGLVRRLTRA